MKRFLFSTAALAIVGLSLGAGPAHAGHWAVTLAGSCSGDENTYVFANNGPGNSYPYEGTTLVFNSLIVSGSSFAQGEQVVNQYMNDRQAAGTLGVQATFTWTLDHPGDTSTPPSTVNVLESGYANSGGLDSGQGDSELMQAYDGFTYTYSGYPGMSFQDPCQYTNINSGYPFRLSTTTSQGSYVTTNISIPTGTTSFTLPVRTVGLGLLSNVGPTESGPGGTMSYTASLDTAADFTVTVAAASTSIGTATTATVTVQSVNGFAGTVALSSSPNIARLWFYLSAGTALLADQRNVSRYRQSYRRHEWGRFGGIWPDRCSAVRWSRWDFLSHFRNSNKRWQRDLDTHPDIHRWGNGDLSDPSARGLYSRFWFGHYS